MILGFKGLKKKNLHLPWNILWTSMEHLVSIMEYNVTSIRKQLTLKCFSLKHPYFKK